MSEPVYLPLRAESNRWVKTNHYLGVFSLSLFAFSAFWVRVISENANGETYRVLLEVLRNLMWITGIAAACWVVIVGVIYLLESAQIISLYQQQALGTIGLSENMLLLDDQTIAVGDLQSIVLTSDQYAGAPRGRSISSGAGKISVVYKATKQEVAFLIIVRSAQELHKLRELSACWRRQQVTAFIMD